MERFDLCRSSIQKKRFQVLATWREARSSKALEVVEDPQDPKDNHDDVNNRNNRSHCVFDRDDTIDLARLL